jgi:hypothetical protein
MTASFPSEPRCGTESARHLTSPGALVKSVCEPADGQRDMTYFTVRTRTWLAISLLMASAAGVAGCNKIGEDGTDFMIVNGTSRTVTVHPHFEAPGQPAPPTGRGVDQLITLAPGARQGVRFPFVPNECVQLDLQVYNSGGGLVATHPAPICTDKTGNGGTWTITTP